MTMYFGTESYFPNFSNFRLVYFTGCQIPHPPMASVIVVSENKAINVASNLL